MKPYEKLFPELRRQMKEIDMTQDELAYYMGRSRVYVTRVFTGKTSPRLDELIKIMDIVGLKDELVFNGRLRLK